MSQFDGELIISYDVKASKILGGDYWRLRKSFRCYIPSTFVDLGITAPDKSLWGFCPSGLLTDLGTIPPRLRGIINNSGAAAQAYVLHDQLCEYLSLTFNGRPYPITRQECDLILKGALIDLEIDKTTAELIYNAVAAYAFVMNIRDPSTCALKRRLEADYNFEDCQ